MLCSGYDSFALANEQTNKGNEMRVMVFGGMHMNGKSSKTGLPYDMARLYVASNIRPASKENYTRTGFGFEAAEVDCDSSVIESLQGRSFPAILTLETEMRLLGGKFVPTVVAIVDDVKKVAA